MRPVPRKQTILRVHWTDLYMFHVFYVGMVGEYHGKSFMFVRSSGKDYIALRVSLHRVLAPTGVLGFRKYTQTTL